MISILILVCLFVSFQEPKAPFPLTPGHLAGLQQHSHHQGEATCVALASEREHVALWGLGGLGGELSPLPRPFPNLRGQMEQHV